MLHRLSWEGVVAMATTPQALQVNGGKLWFACDCWINFQLTVVLEQHKRFPKCTFWTPDRPLKKFQSALCIMKNILLMHCICKIVLLSIFATCLHYILNSTVIKQPKTLHIGFRGPNHLQKGPPNTNRLRITSFRKSLCSNSRGLHKYACHLRFNTVAWVIIVSGMYYGSPCLLDSGWRSHACASVVKE